MANAAKMIEKQPARILLLGFPKAGKTGALAPLVDAGFKLRVLDFDGNMESLLLHVKDKSKLANVDIVFLEDKLRNGARFIETAGNPTAFSDGLKLLDEWKYTDEDGTEVSLGKSKEWGRDTIVVIDSLTTMGYAAKRRAMAMLNKTPLNSTQQMWGLAMQEQQHFIEKFTSSKNKFHIIVTSHLKMLSPNQISSDEDDVNKGIKEKQADLIPTRYYPNALGKALPPEIGGAFPTILLMEKVYKGANLRRVIRTQTGAELDTGIPAPNMPAELDISDGMLRVFDALTGGYRPTAVGSDTPTTAQETNQ